MKSVAGRTASAPAAAAEGPAKDVLRHALLELWKERTLLLSTMKNASAVENVLKPASTMQFLWLSRL